MKNSEVAGILNDIAEMLEMQGIRFKPNAYRKAARSVEESAEDLNEILSRGKNALKKLPGVGDSIAEKIEELLETGRLGYYEEIREKFPRHISELMQIPGLGPKRIKILHEKLKISGIRQLEEAAAKHKIAKLATFGKKSEEDIVKGIELYKSSRARMLLGRALPMALKMESRLKKLKSVRNAGIAGSLRRRKETIGDVDVLVSSAKPEGIMDFFTSMPEVGRILAKGSSKSSVILKSGFQVDLRVVPEESFGAALQYFTGSTEHNVAAREIAISKGLKLNEYGIFKGKKKIAGATEKSVYKALGMDWPEPELRENRGEIDAALKGKLPEIIRYGSVRGDFHAHTTRSDGANSVEEMVLAAKKLGHEYVAITDHSKSIRIANGLSEEKMLKHVERIRKIDKKITGIKVLAGSEVDILPNGKLDYSKELLQKFDVVVGSVHSGFKSGGEAMTSRILTALENPYIDILGHPTGRRIGKRESYAADMNEIFRTAAKNKVYLEINSHPERSDLNDVNVMAARKHNCRFAIDTDAHSVSDFQYVNLGISIARRAWLTQKDVINTAPAGQLHKFFKRIK